MSLIIGKYQHVRNENIDEYFKSLGVPYLARKMMNMSHPTIEIAQDGDKWTIKNTTIMSNQEVSFTLGTEYEEVMPSGDKLRSTTTLEGNSLIVVSKTNDENKVVRKYDFSDGELILTMTQEKSEQVARRFYKRVA